MMNDDGLEAGEPFEPDQSLEAAVRRVFDDLSREEFGEPADMFAVTRDDELLDWLGAADLDAEPAPPPGQDPADAELIEMLLAWRRSVATDASEPAPPPPPGDAAAPGRRHTGRRHTGRRRRVPVVSAVLAVLMVCVGLGAAVQDAMPGDRLWGVSKALNSERATSIETTAQTRRYLDVAHTELVLGHRAAAAAALAAAQREIAQMRSDDDKRELQARQRELTDRLNRTTPASGQLSGSGATTPPSRQREDGATSVPPDEQQARPSRSPFPQAAAPAGTPSTISEPSLSDEPETMTPDSSAPGSDTPGASRSVTELSKSAAAVAGSQVEPSRDGEHVPSDRPGKGGDTEAAVSSDSAQPPTGAPSSASADQVEDADSNSHYERHAESLLPPSTSLAQPAKRSAKSQSQPSSSANRDLSASSIPEGRANPAAQSGSSSTLTSAAGAGETVVKDKTVRERRRTSSPSATPDPVQPRAAGAADVSAHRVYDHNKAAAATVDSSVQPSSPTSRPSDENPSSPGSTALANPDHPPTGTPAPDHRDGQEPPW